MCGRSGRTYASSTSSGTFSSSSSSSLSLVLFSTGPSTTGTSSCLGLLILSFFALDLRLRRPEATLFNSVSLMLLRLGSEEEKNLLIWFYVIDTDLLGTIYSYSKS